MFAGVLEHKPNQCFRCVYRLSHSVTKRGQVKLIGFIFLVPSFDYKS